jgi:hypothetical protein
MSIMTVNAGMDARLIAFRASETAQTNQFRDRPDGSAHASRLR